MAKPFEDVPRGNTSKGVNREVIAVLVDRFGPESEGTLFDIPCGEGQLMAAVRRYLPRWSVLGGDIDVSENASDMLRVDGARLDGSVFPHGLKAFTCVSGVVEFDNTLSFFEAVRGELVPDGLLIVSNDNLLSVRDRLLYLFAGRFGQYPLKFGRGRATWNVKTLDTLTRVIEEAGFDVESIRYIPVIPANWLWLPLALPLFIISRLTLSTTTLGRDPREVLPLRAFLSKHYLLICRPC